MHEADFLKKKKFLRRAAVKKDFRTGKGPKTKTSCVLKFPLHPHHFSNGPSLSEVQLFHPQNALLADLATAISSINKIIEKICLKEKQKYHVAKRCVTVVKISVSTTSGFFNALLKVK